MHPNICSRYERLHCSRIKQHNYRGVIDEKHTSDYIRRFMRFFHGHTIVSPTGVVLLDSNRNRVGSMGRVRCSYSGLVETSAWIQASVGIMSLFTTLVAPTFNFLWVLDSLGSPNTLIPSNRSLEVVGALNHLTLWGREFLSSCLWPWLKLQLSRTKQRSS
jgi:hypothetical protein